VITVEDSDGNKHDIVTDSLPTTVTDQNGDTYEIREKENGEVELVDTRIEKMVNAVGDGDTKLYLIAQKIGDTVSITSELIQKIKAEATVFYENGESFVLSDGRYVLIPYQKYIKFKIKIKKEEAELIKAYNDIQYIKLLSDGRYTIDKEEQSYNLYSMECNLFSASKEGYIPYKEVILEKGKLYKLDVERPERGLAKDISSERIDIEKYLNLNTTFNEADFRYVEKRLVSTTDIYGVKSTFKINVQDLDAEAVWFEAGYSYDGSYGFDNYKDNYGNTLKGKYTPLTIKKSNGQTVDYRIPSVSMWAEKEVTVLALIQGKVGDKVHYKFESDSTNLDITDPITGIVGKSFEYQETLKSDKTYLSLTIQNKNTASTYDNPIALKVKDKGDQIVGQLNIHSIQLKDDNTETIRKKYSVIDVTLGTSQNSTQIDPVKYQHNLLTFLNNKAYNQSFIQFGDNVQFSRLTIPNLGNVQVDAEGDIIESDPNEKNLYNLLVNATTAASNSGATDYIIFIINNRNYAKRPNGGRVSGFSMNKDVVLLKMSNEDWETVVHELGHCLDLKHPFAEYPNDINEGDTNNYMDYSPKINMFWKWQWDIMRKK
jgi:hypothetical protein